MSVNLSRAVHVQNGRIYDGKAEQTHADAITFDNTGTDLVSENVEGAIKEVNAKTSGLTRMTKLWENPSPTASFAAQNITLANDDYDFLMLIWQLSSGYYDDTNIVRKGQGTYLTSSSYPDMVSRVIQYTNDTTLNVNNALRNSAIDNSVLIPVKIYGIKLI